MNQQKETLDIIKILGNLDKLGQRMWLDSELSVMPRCDLSSDDKQNNYIRQGRNEQMPDKWISNLWFKAPDHDQIIGQRQGSHDFEQVKN